MQKKVLLAFDDPGGGLAVTSLIDSLRLNKKISLSIYSGKLSEKFLKAKKISYEKLDSASDKTTGQKNS
jgi:exopolyphosphatase/pppGpp-phosphohydrolase